MNDEIEDIISDEVETITTLEAELIDVTAALEQIEEESGVTKQLALSVEQYLPEDLPVASFTQMPTRTNYEVTVTSLENRKNAIIGAIVVALIAIVSKLIEWVFSRKSRQEMDKAVERIQSLKAESENIDRKAKETKHNGNVSDDGKTFEYSGQRRKADDEIKALAKTYGEKLESVWNQFVQQNFIRLESKNRSLFELQEDVLVGYVNNVIASMDYFKDLVDRDHESLISASSEFDSLIGLLSDKAKYLRGKVDSGYVANDSRGQTGASGHGLFFQDTMRDVKEQVDYEQSQPGADMKRPGESIDVISDLVAAGSIDPHFKHQVRDPFFWRDDRVVQRNLKDLKKNSESLKNHTDVRSELPQVAIMAKDALKILRREVWAIMAFVKILESLTENQEKCVKVLLEYNEKRVNIEKKHLMVK